MHVVSADQASVACGIAAILAGNKADVQKLTGWLDIALVTEFRRF